ncbi:MAG: hypothetical protein ACRBBN_04945 [Methyloligellaceae bacterium]
MILKFETGLMAGSERFIELTGFTIGSGSQADVILLDDDIFDEHIAINITRSLLGVSITVHALQENVQVSGTTLQINNTITRQSDIDITLSNTSLKIMDARGYVYNNNKAENDTKLPELDGETLSSLSLSKNMLALLSAIALIFIGLAIILFSSDTDEVTSNTAIATKPEKQDSDKKTFLLDLRNKVREVGLTPYISIKADTNNTLKVTGELQQTHSHKWRKILQWYDTQESPPPLFNQVIELSDQNNLPEIKLVNLGDQKYALLGNNRRAFVGETIDKDWKIESINDRGILVSKANQKILVQFK